MRYSLVAVIYNPNSTGSSKELATEFVETLAHHIPRKKITLYATEYAGHAEEIAYKAAKSHAHPLIISSSGDGGYHEVINGALRAQKEGAHPITGLLPAGNANDHYNNLHDIDTIDAIVDGRTRQIDVLKLVSTVKGKRITRYAHSYIGFGVTPWVGKELNKYKLTILNEAWIVLGALFAVKPVRLLIGKKAHYYDSIVLSNVDKMAKVLRVSQPSRITDGKFEVTMFRRRNKIKLILLLLHASIIGAKEDKSVKTFSAKTFRPTLVQCDGEVMTLDANTSVTVSAEHEALRCIV